MNEKDVVIINDKKYSLISDINYNNETYYLAVGLDQNNKYSFYDTIIIKFENNDAVLVEDQKLIKKLCEIFVEN